MYMFLPFLIALSTALSAMKDNKKIAYICWMALLVVTLLSFKYHASDALHLSF